MTKKKVIEFCSTPDNYANEENGSKPNTVRFTRYWSSEFLQKYGEATHIKITKSKSNDFFERELTNKTIYKGIAIFSWRHDGGTTYYPVIRLSKLDMIHLFEGENNYREISSKIEGLSDNLMWWVARKLADDYCNQLYWSSLRHFTDEVLRQNEQGTHSHTGSEKAPLNA